MYHFNPNTLFSLRYIGTTGAPIVYTYDQGRIISPEILNDGQYDVEHFARKIDYLDRWVNTVYMLEAPDKESPPDSPTTEEYEIEDDKIKLKLEVQGLQANLTYDMATKLITTKARPQFNISWMGFLYFINSSKRFLQLINGDFLS